MANREEARHPVQGPLTFWQTLNFVQRIPIIPRHTVSSRVKQVPFHTGKFMVYSNTTNGMACLFPVVFRLLFERTKTTISLHCPAAGYAGP